MSENTGPQGKGMSEENIEIPVDIARAWLESLEALAARDNGPKIHIWPNHPYDPIAFLRKAVQRKPYRAMTVNYASGKGKV